MQELDRLRKLKRLRELEAKLAATGADGLSGRQSRNQQGMQKLLARETNGNINSNMGVPSNNGLPNEQVGQRAVEEKSFFQNVGDFFTGNDRATDKTRELPEIGSGGLLFGEDKTRGAMITPALLSATDPEEMAQILTSNFDNIGIVRDQQGNVFAANNKTGIKVVLNKPGFSKIDLLQGLGLVALFTPAGRSTGALRVAGTAGATSAGIESLQAVSGGDFSFKQIAIDTVAAGVLDKAFTIAKQTGKKLKDVLKFDAGIDPDAILKGIDDELLGEVDSAVERINAGKILNQAKDAKMTPAATGRVNQAQEFNTQLTKAQATGDFAASEAEQTLLKSVSKEGDQARLFVDKQQAQLKAAADKFTQKFGGSARLAEATGEFTEQTVRDKGAVIQGTLSDIQEFTRKEVSELYSLAGETAGDAIPLNNATIVDIADDIIVNRPITPEVEKSINTALAKFGLIGDSVEQASRNKFKVMDGEQAILITGEVTPLNLSNAEAFRTALNKAVGADQTGSAKVIVSALDGQVNDIIEQGAKGGGNTARTQAFATARDAFIDQKTKFSAKDVIQDLVGFKKGTKTPVIDPETVIAKIVKGDKSVTNIRKIKQILLENPSETSKKAWRSIQAETVGDILSQAINKDSLEISGARLNSAMKKYRPEALRELLGKKQYAELRRLQETIGTATIPPPGTTNPSGTFTKLFAMAERLGNFAGAGQFNFGSLAFGAARKSKELATRKKVLNDIVNTKIKEITKANPSMSRKSVEQTAKAMAFLQIRELDKKEEK